MQSGKLRHPIVIEYQLSTQSESGAPVNQWVSFTATWASIEPLSGRDYYAAKQINSDITHKIRMRHIDGVTPDMRITHQGIIYEIITAMNPETVNRELTVMCRQRL